MSVKININNAPDIPKTPITVLYFNISKYTQTVQFIICCSAVFVFFLLYGYMQELIFTIDGFQPYGWFLTLVQFGFYSIFGTIEYQVQQIGPRRVPLKTYSFFALLTLGTMGFSNASLGYLNYPTQVIFKCCKLIPVMAGSILIQGKRYGPLDFVAALMMCVGLTLFTLADSQLSPNFNTTGIIMISIALLCDAIIGNVQEKNMKVHNATNTEIVLFSYAIGFVYIFLYQLVTGEFMDGIKYFSINSSIKYGYAFIFSLTGYLGIQVVLTLVRTCGAFAAVTVTTCRKAVTIIISFLFFSKPFAIQYVWSGMLVVLGIYLNMYSKKHPLTLEDMELKIHYFFRHIKLKIISRQSKTSYMTNV